LTFLQNKRKIQVDESELFLISEPEEVDPKELLQFLQRTVPLIFESIEENSSLKSLQSSSKQP